MVNQMLPWVLPSVAEPSAASVEARIREAMGVAALLDDSEQRYLIQLRAAWPIMSKDKWDDPEPVRNRRERPDIRSISRMDEVLDWLWWIEDHRARKIVMARRAGASWRVIVDKSGFGRTWCIASFHKGLHTVCCALRERGHKM